MTALKDVRIVELTAVITGPLAGQMLADLGADVIKVENPDGGDMFRNWRGGLYSSQFLAYNRNKRSVTLNLRSADGKDVFLRLVETADVLLENFRPGVMERLGLGLDVLRARNPRLIYCSITGFGEDGPYMHRPAYDAVAQSLSGLSSMFLDPDNPQITGPTIADNMTGINAAYGILGALFERERTGVARRIDVNMLEAGLTFMPDPWSNLINGEIPQGPLARVKASQSYAMRCADGKLVAIHLSSPPKFWQGVQNAFERTDLGSDPRFAEREGRISNYVELRDEFQKAAETKPRDYWMARLEAEDVPFAPVNTLPEVFDDPQIKHLDPFFTTSHPTEGEMTLLRRPVRFDGSRDDQPLNPPPTLGEHTAKILAELGYDEGAVERLRQGEII
jgi:formyl-CoA transferase